MNFLFTARHNSIYLHVANESFYIPCIILMYVCVCACMCVFLLGPPVLRSGSNWDGGAATKNMVNSEQPLNGMYFLRYCRCPLFRFYCIGIYIDQHVTKDIN